MRADSSLGARVLTATACGLGRLPLAPGTWGSLAGVALVWGLARLGGPIAVVAGMAVVATAGFWSAGVAATRLGGGDPGSIVVDEIAGQMLALAPFDPTPRTLVVGFVLFRAFDIWKPFPVRRLESLPGASGIMTDDLMAGVYACAVQQALQWGLPGIWGAT